MKNALKLMVELMRIYKFMEFVFMAKYVYFIAKNISTVLKTKSLGCVDKEFDSDISLSVFGEHKVFHYESMPTVREIVLKNCYGIEAKRYPIVVDLGANRGVVGSLIGDRCNHYIAIEVNPEFKSIFKKHMKDNGVNQYSLINKFASNSDDENNISINTIIEQFKLSEISLLKIDIEGAETQLFSSNLGWLDKVKEITMEVHPCFGVDEQLICNILRDKGFNVELFDLGLNTQTKLKSTDMGYIRAKK